MLSQMLVHPFASSSYVAPSVGKTFPILIASIVLSVAFHLTTFCRNCWLCLRHFESKVLSHERSHLQTATLPSVTRFAVAGYPRRMMLIILDSASTSCIIYKSIYRHVLNGVEVLATTMYRSTVNKVRADSWSFRSNPGYIPILKQPQRVFGM